MCFEKKTPQLHGPQKKPPEITSLAGESTILKRFKLDVAKKTSELREVPCYQNFSQDFRISQEYPKNFRQNLHVERLNL